MMGGRYILDEVGKPVLCEDMSVWGRWFEKADRHVAFDKLDGAGVSTVFLAFDHSFEEKP